MWTDNLLFTFNMVFAALLGVAVGSFTNNWAYRLVRGRSVIKGRSECQSCGHKLGILDLVPVLSYLFLGGKCRFCEDRISPRYLVVELASGLLYMLLAYTINPIENPIEFIRWAILIALLTTLTLQDMETMELSDGIMIMILVLGLALLYWAPEGIMMRVASAFSIALPVYIISMIADKIMGIETMGGGDIKLFFVLGLHLSIQQMVFMFLMSCIIGIILSLVTSKNDDVGEKVEDESGKKHALIPFGPAICISSLIAAFWGNYIIEIYLSLFKG